MTAAIPYGQLTVICGPMFAGKTTELRARIAAAQHAKQHVMICKPAEDHRYARDAIVTHTGHRTPARAVATLDEIINLPADVVAIDEIHFFGAAAHAAIDRLRVRGSAVIVAGCDIDHFGRTFAPFDTLLPIATEVIRLSGTCARCGRPSTHSERIIKGTERIVVGGVGDFIPTCATCFQACG